MKRISMILLCLVLALQLGATALAAGTVSYDGNAGGFIFQPGSEHSPTDLFEDLKDVMPGDKLEEQITIRNDSTRGVKIKVYIRSLGAQEETQEFLSKLLLTVSQQGDSVLFQAPADQTAQLTDWVYLGTVYSGGEITLDVALEVPLSLGDEYQNQVGYIDWEFKVEEFPKEPSDPDIPQTGDDFHLALYAGLMGFSLLALILLLLAKRKRDPEDNA